jgi:hypothetical protein
MPGEERRSFVRYASSIRSSRSPLASTNVASLVTPAEMRPSWCTCVPRNQAAARPFTDRTKRSSPRRTTQIVVGFRSAPSGPTDAICSWSDDPILSSSSPSIPPSTPPPSRHARGRIVEHSCQDRYLRGPIRCAWRIYLRHSIGDQGLHHRLRATRAANAWPDGLHATAFWTRCRARGVPLLCSRHPTGAFDRQRSDLFCGAGGGVYRAVDRLCRSYGNNGGGSAWLTTHLKVRRSEPISPELCERRVSPILDP